MSDSASAPAPRPRRYRPLQEKLGQVVLAFESIIVFLAGLTIYGLRATPDGIAPWWGIVAGLVMFVLLLLTSGMLRARWGYAVGWALQAVIALGAFLVPSILLVAIVFGGLWAYATIGGARVERRVAKQRADAEAADPSAG